MEQILPHDFGKGQTWEERDPKESPTQIDDSDFCIGQISLALPNEKSGV
jgi:hypothetical protein